MGSTKVRAVITTEYGCRERTAWYPKGSTEATEAMQELAQKQTVPFLVSWEERDEGDSEVVE